MVALILQSYQYKSVISTMHFGTLNQTTIENLSNTFNEAFADYALPMQFSPDALNRKIRVEDIDLSLSVAAFDNDRPVGFILFGIDTVNGQLCAWDGGTGVTPGYRGLRLTHQMFEYILPLLKERGAKRILLEVLKSNEQAHAIYNRIGFNKTRELHAYAGSITRQPLQQHQIEELTQTDVDSLLQLGDWMPAWQQMSKRVSNWGDAIATYGITDNGKTVAYAHLNKTNRRVVQFAVDKAYRRRSAATTLFHHMAQGEPLTTVNVDDSCEQSNLFLNAIGMHAFISQYEMEMML